MYSRRKAYDAELLELDTLLARMGHGLVLGRYPAPRGDTLLRLVGIVGMTRFA